MPRWSGITPPNGRSRNTWRTGEAKTITLRIPGNLRESAKMVDAGLVGEVLRIPGNLDESAKEVFALRGMSLSAFVRNCMIQELSKRS